MHNPHYRQLVIFMASPFLPCPFGNNKRTSFLGMEKKEWKKMKNDYMIRIEHDENDVTVFNFHCTRSQVDKLFFALAYASPASSIRFASIYLVHSSPKDVDLTNCYELLNTFSCKRV